MAFIGNTPTAVPLTGSQIADGTIINANIATNTINLTQKVTSALAATNGGTGTSSYTAGNILYASNATTLVALAPGTSGYALTLNGTTPTWAAVGASAGQVIQVVGDTDTTTRNTTSATYVAFTGLSVSITPSSTSNRIFLTATICAIGGGGIGSFTFFRDSTNLGLSHGLMGTFNTAEYDQSSSMTFLDSPNTTSAITYQVYFRAHTATFGSYANGTFTNSITAFEIKG